MGNDKRGISRGQCSLCDCDEFESSGVRCDYCGHTPVDHLPLEQSKNAAEMGVLYNDPDNTDDEVRSLQKRVDSLASDNEVFEIQRRNGKVVAFCNICTTAIATGEAH